MRQSTVQPIGGLEKVNVKTDRSNQEDGARIRHSSPPGLSHPIAQQDITHKDAAKDATWSVDVTRSMTSIKNVTRGILLILPSGRSLQKR
jgi:hypothetical protein